MKAEDLVGEAVAVVAGRYMGLVGVVESAGRSTARVMYWDFRSDCGRGVDIHMSDLRVLGRVLGSERVEW